MSKSVIYIQPNGDINFVDANAQCLEKLGSTTKRRISRVEPVNPVLRWLFHVIRSLSSDRSFFAEHTRHWRCKWRVRMLDSGFIFEAFENRHEAIAAEIERWNQVESKV